jgi:spermidine synthase
MFYFQWALLDFTRMASTTRHLFLLIYAVSGAAALIDEVAWTRLLTMQMGHTVAGVSTVLAAFMGGLALGAIAAGRYTTRLDRRRAIQLYVALEGFVALFALVLPGCLAAARPLLAWTYADGDGGWLFGSSRLAIALLLLLPPATAMGATLPLATRWLVDRLDRAGADTGGLYAANATGSTLGAALAGFLLLPSLGLRLTIATGAAASLLAAAAALWLSRRPVPGVAAPESAARTVPMVTSGHVTPSRRPAADARTRTRMKGSSARPDRRGAAPEVIARAARPTPLWVGATALGLSGFTALASEVTWTRLLALVIGPTTYAFSTMLAVFIGGLAGGSTLGSRLAARVRTPAVWLAAAMVAVGASATVLVPIVGRLPVTIAGITGAPGASFSSVVARQSLITGALLLPMTVALGLTFPLAVAAVARRLDSLARDVAVIYAWNTVGAIGGALAAGFLLIPIVGLRGTIVLAVLSSQAGALLLLWRGGGSRGTQLVGGVGTVVVVAAAVSMPGWNPSLVSAGAYKYAPYVGGLDLQSALEAGELLYYAEGAAATVSVRRTTGTVSMAIDGKIDASNGGDMLTQKLLAHLPLLLHPAPRDVCVVGLGSGVTAGAVLAHPVRRLDVVEISPEVLQASRWFEQENRRALDDPRTNLILGDGRSHLLLSAKRYDVIISEPSNPWIAGMAALFTREFLLAARARLSPDGLMCQWAHTYDMSEADLRTLLATFASVFPDGTLWLVGDGDLLFISGRRSIDDRLSALRARWAALPDVRRDLEAVSVGDASALLSLFLGGQRLLGRFSTGAAVHTDDRLQLEFSGPRSIYGLSAPDHAGALRALAEAGGIPPWIVESRLAAGAAWWRGLGRMALRAEAFNTAYEAFLRATDLGADDEETLAGLAQAAATTGHGDELLARLRELRARYPQSVGIRVELSRVLAARGDVEEAIGLAFEARAIAPDSAAAREQLASIYADRQQVDRLSEMTAEMRRASPDAAATWYYTATERQLQGQVTEAIALAERAVRADPRHARAWALLGAAHATVRQPREARQAFEQSIRADSRDATVYSNLALLDEQEGNLKAAAGRLAEALLVEPGFEAARGKLADVLERLGARERAEQVRKLGAGSR